MSMFAEHFHSNFGAWQEVYDRWVQYTKGVLLYEEEGESTGPHQVIYFVYCNNKIFTGACSKQEKVE